MRGFLNSLILVLLVYTSASGQNANPVADSLKALLAKIPDDTTKVNLFLQISRAYFNESWDDVIRYSEAAAKLSGKLEFEKGEALAYKNIGLGNIYQGIPIKAIEAWEKSLEKYRAIGDKNGEANMLSNLGGVFVLSDDSKALDYYLQSLRLAEEIRDSFRIATLNINIAALYDKKSNTLANAMESYRRAIAISEKNKYDEALGMATGNMGDIYLNKNQIDSALYYYRIGEVNLRNQANHPLALNNIGKAYLKRKDFKSAFYYLQMAFDEAEKTNNKIYMEGALLGIADVYSQQGELKQAMSYYKRAEKMSTEMSDNEELRKTYAGLAFVYSRLKDYANAYQYQLKLSDIQEKIYNEETDNKLANLRFDFDLQKKQNEISLLSRDKALQELELNRQKLAKNALIAGLGLVSLIIFILYRDYRGKIRINRILDQQKEEIETLLLNILPAEVAHELQKEGVSTPRFYESASVLFTDFKSFTKLADEMTPQQVIEELNSCFIVFDEIMDKYGLEKIKTIGDAYMCAGGIPTPDPKHYLKMIKAAREIQRYILERNKERGELGIIPWEIRIGIHVGPIVAGVVGRKKYAYDIWGSTVNIASRMESNGEPGMINISAATYELVRDLYECTYRGKIYAKNVGEIDMYFLGEEKTSVVKQVEYEAGSQQ
jgi:class 3 adenylate cyclase